MRKGWERSFSGKFQSQELAFFLKTERSLGLTGCRLIGWGHVVEDFECGLQNLDPAPVLSGDLMKGLGALCRRIDLSGVHNENSAEPRREGVVACTIFRLWQ